MPRKQIVHKRFESNMLQERRTKASHERQGQQQFGISPTPSTPTPIPDKYASKPITTGRRIDFRFFQKEGFQTREKIKSMS